MFNKKTIKDIDIQGKQVVLRADWDVPADDNGEVTDDFRIRASVPTIQYLLDQDCSIVVLSKRGRPEGPDTKNSLQPVAEVAGKILGQSVQFADDLVGETAAQAVQNLRPKDILLLQNTRFYPEEANGDKDFAMKLASYGEVFVFDAFAMAHRTDTSVVGLNQYLPAVAGLLIEKEITELSKAIDNPAKPLLAITGGAKLETKLPLLHNFLKLADHIVVAGVMANIMLKAKGMAIGKSSFSDEDINTAKEIITQAETAGVRFVLPEKDVAVAKDRADTNRREVATTDVSDDDYILDFGTQSVDEVIELIKSAQTIIWNGPLGMYENPAFAVGSQKVAQAIADTGAISVVGGGDTADVVNSLGLAAKFTHVSTGGGASLDFMSGHPLPAIEALLDK